MAAESRTPDGREVDDHLESPTLDPRLLVRIGVGALVFVCVAIALLTLFYHLLLRNPARQPVHPFPLPRLETSIDPRSMPATPETGPAPPKVQTRPPEPSADMERAMQVVVARGPHAYDPLPAPAGSATP